MGENYNLNYVIALYDHDMETVKQILEIFLETSPDIWRALKEANNNNYFETVKEKAHSLKPTIELLEMGDLKQEILNIELAAEQQDKDKLNRLIENFDPIITGIFADIQEEFEEM